MSAWRALLPCAAFVVVAGGCGGAPKEAHEPSAAPSAAKIGAAPTPANSDVCQRAIVSHLRDLPVTPSITLFTTPGVESVDAKAAALDGWLRALVATGATAGTKIDYRWIGVTDEASRKYARDMGLAPAALAKDEKPDERGRSVVLDDTFFGVAIGAGVDLKPVVQLGNVKPSAARAWIENATRSVVARARGRTRRVGFVTGGSASGGVSLDHTELASASGGGPRSTDLTEHLRRNLPHHELVPVELAKGVPESTDVLVLTQPGGALSEAERRHVDDFLMRGDKTLLVVASSANVPPYGGSLRPTLDAHGLDRLLEPYGVTLSSDVIADPDKSLRIDVVRGNGARAAVSVPGIPMIEVDAASAPFFGSKPLVFPFASHLNVHAERQPGAKIRVIGRTGKTATSIRASGTDLGPEASVPKGMDQGSFDVAVEAQGDLRSAFGSSHAPATLYVLSSSLLLANPFAWAGNAPPESSPMTPPAGEPALQQLAQAYGQELTNVFLVLMNAIDARAENDDVRACTALLASDAALDAAGSGKGPSGRPEAFRPPPESPVLAGDQLARVTKLEIQTGGSSVIVERKGSAWRTVSPGSGEVESDRENVRRALENLGEVRMRDVIANGTAGDSSLGLGTKDSLRLVASAGAERVLDVTVGRSGDRGTAMRTAGEGTVRLARGFSRWLFDTKPTRWRRTQLWQLEKGEVQRVEIENARGKWVFDRTSTGWKGTSNGRPVSSLLANRVADVVNAFREPHADDFAEPGADAGLDKPSKPSTISFVLDGGRRQTIEIGKPRKGGGRYARVAGEPTVYVIPEYVAAWSDAAVEGFKVQ